LENIKLNKGFRLYEYTPAHSSHWQANPNLYRDSARGLFLDVLCYALQGIKTL
jgi:hypothetical protein